MKATAPSTYHSLLPSGTPPLLPIPLLAPSTSRRADIPKADTPPQKRLLLTTPRPSCEVGESYAAAATRQLGPTMAHRVDYSLVNTRETRPWRLEHALTHWRTRVAVLDFVMIVATMQEHCCCMAEAEVSRVRQLLYTSNGSGPRPAQAVRECSYSEFLKCKPLDFKGTEESSDSLDDDALTWGEIKKIETEMWNLKVKGTDVVAYSRRFQQLALMCSRMFPEEIDKIEKYIGGLPEMIMAV
ncbi:hypothetical protein Tco_1124572 [Tanacetum coccineum]|uniref:Reverse transcriptase domain-containing protein n=1 Tax=Tanacetum coccineum TaxID=301880 RepID=A0ABQ5J6H6_9ASTR